MKFVCHILCKYLHTGHRSVVKPLETHSSYACHIFVLTYYVHFDVVVVSKGVFEERTASGSGLFEFLAGNSIQISGQIVSIKTLSDTLC